MAKKDNKASWWLKRIRVTRTRVYVFVRRVGKRTLRLLKQPRLRWTLAMLAVVWLLFPAWVQGVACTLFASTLFVLRWLAYDASTANLDLEDVRNLALTVVPLSGLIVAVMGYVLARRRLDTEEKKRDDDREAREDERYARAVAMLGHEHLSVRLGGILELKQLGKTGKNHLEQVLRSLEVFMRDRSPLKGPDAKSSQASHVKKAAGEDDVPCEQDVRDALKAYGALLRVWDEDGGEERMDAVTRDLSGLNFGKFEAPKNLYLARCIFDGSDLSCVEMEHVDLRFASLKDADLDLANLENAKLGEARLEEADLSKARLERTSLSEANLFAATITHEWEKTYDTWNPRLNKSRFSVAQAKSLYVLGWPVFDRSKMLFFKRSIDAHASYDFEFEAESEAAVREAVGLPPEPEPEG